jgi:hypothetical protein
VGLSQLAGLDHLIIRGVAVAPAEIVLDRAGEQQILLEHHSHLIAESVEIVVPDVHAADPDRALGDVVETGDELDESGLGGAGAADYAMVSPDLMWRFTSARAMFQPCRNT